MKVTNHQLIGMFRYYPKVFNQNIWLAADARLAGLLKSSNDQWLKRVKTSVWCTDLVANRRSSCDDNNCIIWKSKAIPINKAIGMSRKVTLMNYSFSFVIIKSAGRSNPSAVFHCIDPSVAAMNSISMHLLGNDHYGANWIIVTIVTRLERAFIKKNIGYFSTRSLKDDSIAGLHWDIELSFSKGRSIQLRFLDYGYFREEMHTFKGWICCLYDLRSTFRYMGRKSDIETCKINKVTNVIGYTCIPRVSAILPLESSFCLASLPPRFRFPTKNHTQDRKKFHLPLKCTKQLSLSFSSPLELWLHRERNILNFTKSSKCSGYLDPKLADKTILKFITLK